MVGAIDFLSAARTRWSDGTVVLQLIRCFEYFFSSRTFGDLGKFSHYIPIVGEIRIFCWPSHRCQDGRSATLTAPNGQAQEEAGKLGWNHVGRRSIRCRAIELGDFPLFSYRKLMTCPTWGFTWCFMAKHSVSTQPGWMWGFCTLRCLRCTQTELHGIKPQHNNINMNDLLVHTLLVGVAGYYVLLSSLVYIWTTCYNHRVQDLSMDFLTLAIPCSLLKPRSEKSSWFKIRFLENWIVKITKTKRLQWYHSWGQHHIEARLNWK